MGLAGEGDAGVGVSTERYWYSPSYRCAGEPRRSEGGGSAGDAIVSIAICTRIASLASTSAVHLSCA
jgi:hypothetical protein